MKPLDEMERDMAYSHGYGDGERDSTTTHRPITLALGRFEDTGEWFGPLGVDFDALQRASDAATPGPWIREWESTEVHYMGGKDGLTSMVDIDFAIACVAAIRAILDEDER